MIPDFESRKVWIGLLPAMMLPFVASFFYFVLMKESRIAQGIYGATKFFTLVWPVIAVLWIERPRPLFRFGGWEAHRRGIPAGILTGIAIGGAMLVLYHLTPVGPYLDRSEGAIREASGRLGIVERYWLFCSILAVVHSLLEEYYWRWFVFGRLARVVPAGWAHVLGGLSFAAHHYVVLGQFFPALPTFLFGTGVGLGGGIWSWLYRRHGTLAGAWISHLLVDFAVFWIGARILGV